MNTPKKRPRKRLQLKTPRSPYQLPPREDESGTSRDDSRPRTKAKRRLFSLKRLLHRLKEALARPRPQLKLQR